MKEMTEKAGGRRLLLTKRASAQAWLLAGSRARFGSWPMSVEQTGRPKFSGSTTFSPRGSSLFERHGAWPPLPLGCGEAEDAVHVVAEAAWADVVLHDYLLPAC